ncbi:collagen alpha-2(I) chain [Echinops telfairi]|uniref:Collagen alpha-2(I) chain n=1 Tax=Echinops telfairi TaxID=9371 RepID=A0AC55DBY4_ECHTE|nr:collagen alpha-2(I) chain [Echinops telfairi]
MCTGCNTCCLTNTWTLGDWASGRKLGLVGGSYPPPGSRASPPASRERRLAGGRPWGRRPAAEAPEAGGVNETVGTPRTAGSTEAARDPEVVWVNGAVGEPQVIGPTGSVWVTRSGDEAGTEGTSPRGCERKGRPGSLGHGSILELWLKVQAMRAASGCGEEGRVELLPVPAGEGPLEKGAPGRPSWVETSRGGLTGPWVLGQARADLGATGVPPAKGLVAGSERASGRAVRVPGAIGWTAGVVSCMRGPSVGEEMGSGVARGSWETGQSKGALGAAAWSEAAGVPRTVEEDMGYRGAPRPGRWGRGQAPQMPGPLGGEPACSHTPGWWGRGEAMEVPVLGEETRPQAPGMWQRRPDVEHIGSAGLPGLWGTGHLIRVPFAVEEEARYGGDPVFQERGQAVGVEPGSRGDPGSQRAPQIVGVPGPHEEEAGSGGAPGLWGIGQAMEVPKTWGEESVCGRIHSRWGSDQPVVVPRATDEETGHGGTPGLWTRQQVLGVLPAERVPGVVGEEACCGRVLSHWERGQAEVEPQARGPAALEVPGPAGHDTGCGEVSCPCRWRQAMGLSEVVGLPEAAGVPKHRCIPLGVPTAADVPGSERVAAGRWVSGSLGQEFSPRDVSTLWERLRATRMPLASTMPRAAEELWSVREDTGSGTFPGSWERRQAVGVPLATRVPVDSEEPRPLGDEPGSGGVPRWWGRRQDARVPMAAEVPTPYRVPGPSGMESGCGGLSCLLGRSLTAQAPVAGGMPLVPQWPRLVREETASGQEGVVWRRRETVEVPADARCPDTRLPTSVRVPDSMGERSGSAGFSGLSGGILTAGDPVALGLPGLGGEETHSGEPLCLGRRQMAGVPGTARVPLAVGAPMAPGVPGSLTRDAGSPDDSGIWGRRRVTEGPVALSVPGPVERETGSEGFAGLWRRPSRTAPEVVQGPQALGVLAAVGLPMPGRAPAAVWVTGSMGEEMDEGTLSLAAMSRESTVGREASGQETRSGSFLGLTEQRRTQGALPTCGAGSGLRGCTRPVGEETVCGHVSGVLGARMTREVPEVLGMPLVPREGTGFGLLRGHPQQQGRRRAAGLLGARVRGDRLEENDLEEDRLREASQ